MKTDMQQWLNSLKTGGAKKALPVLSFPTISLMGITVGQLIADSDLQAKGMKAVADRIDSAASVSMMDLSVEAEAFGSEIKVSDGEVPTIAGHILNCLEDAQALAVPQVGAGRTGIYVEAIRKACSLITDRPVLAGVIGPYSLAGRLMDVSEIMVNCYDDPDFVNLTLEKASAFIIDYINAFRKAGANGVVMAEPLTGMLSPRLASAFSAPYVKKIIDAVQTDDFIVVYHNCGNNTVRMIDSILSVGASAYHFGNAIEMTDILERVPADVIVMGNVDPSGQFLSGTPASMREETLGLMERCCKYPNFVVSSGCDIPPLAKWENIDAFFAAVAEFYGRG